jgi:hypothetical protein
MLNVIRPTNVGLLEYVSIVINFTVLVETRDTTIRSVGGHTPWCYVMFVLLNSQIAEAGQRCRIMIARNTVDLYLESPTRTLIFEKHFCLVHSNPLGHVGRGRRVAGRRLQYSRHSKLWYRPMTVGTVNSSDAHKHERYIHLCQCRPINLLDSFYV